MTNAEQNELREMVSNPGFVCLAVDKNDIDDEEYVCVKHRKRPGGMISGAICFPYHTDADKAFVDGLNVLMMSRGEFSEKRASL